MRTWIGGCVCWAAGSERRSAGHWIFILTLLETGGNGAARQKFNDKQAALPTEAVT